MSLTLFVELCIFLTILIFELSACSELKMKVIVFCQALFFCIAIVFTCYNVSERFFTNRVEAWLIVYNYTVKMCFRHLNLKQKEIWKNKIFLFTFQLFQMKDSTFRHWSFMDTIHHLSFLLVLSTGKVLLIGKVSPIHQFKVRCFTNKTKVSCPTNQLYRNLRWKYAVWQPWWYPSFCSHIVLWWRKML